MGYEPFMTGRVPVSHVRTAPFAGERNSWTPACAGMTFCCAGAQLACESHLASIAGTENLDSVASRTDIHPDTAPLARAARVRACVPKRGVLTHILTTAADDSAQGDTLQHSTPQPDDAGDAVGNYDPSVTSGPDEFDEPAENGFAALGLSELIVRAVEEKGYRIPTPIQAQAIPIVLMGRDVLGVAQTGTGKTAGFTLPMLDILQGSRARARMPRSLILEPTRELALQVAENFIEYGKHLKLSHALLIGGESVGDQKEVLMRGVDVLIATPGRLMDMFERGGLLLTDTRILVIDEADRMLDMGFIPDVERIVSFLPKTRQTMLFSATMAPEVKRLADAFLQNPKLITVSRSASVATTIVAGLTLVAEHDKREALRRLIRTEDVQNALIFCNRKRDVDILYKSLKKHGLSVGALHGDLSQPERFATLGKFKAGEIRLLVCSDVAARGLDIGGLSHVFNFDVPIHSEDYVHRIGRTGRAGLTGHAYTLATPDDQRFVEAIEKLIGSTIPRIQVVGLDPIGWAEDGGRSPRGRGRSKPAGRAAPRPAPRAQKEAASDSAPPPERGEKKAEPRRERAGRDRPRTAPVEETVAVAAPEPRAERPVRNAGRDADREFGRPPREGREGRGRERYRRDDDLGPSVHGFGDDVPAFMLIPVRRQAVASSQPEMEQTEA